MKIIRNPKRFIGKIAGDDLNIYNGLSEQMLAFSPFAIESGIIDPRTGRKLTGTPLGTCGPSGSGGIFCYDELIAHKAAPKDGSTSKSVEERLANATNTIVLGRMNFRKSSGLKLKIYRGATMFGLNHLVTDRKGHEYTKLAQAIPGSKILKFGPDSGVFINPLDPSMPIKVRHTLLQSLILDALTDPRAVLSNTENSLLWLAIQETEEDIGEARGVPTLPALIHRIKNPSQKIVDKLGVPQDKLEEITRDMRMALLRMDAGGDLAGMFHKPTTPGVFDPVPLMVLDCSGVSGEAALMVVTLINFFTVQQNLRPNNKARFHHIIHDESWDLASYPGFVESVRRAFKVGRSDDYVFSNTLVAHHWSNLVRSGHPEVEDLLSDSSLLVIYRQDAKEIVSSADALGLNEVEVARAIQLPEGTALYKFKNQPAIEVQYHAFDYEIPLLETSAWTHGKTDLPRAMDIEPVMTV